MIKYEPGVHSIESLDSEVQRIYESHPDALLVGSLGRAGIFHQLGHDPALEFNERGQSPLFYGQNARDIDLVLDGNGKSMEEQPFEVDTGVFNDRRVRFVQENGNWFLVSDRKKFYEPLHPAVMEPVEVETIYGIKCRTVSIKTHLAIFGLKGLMGPKVTHSRELTMRAGSLDETELPAELYQPFAKLKELDKKGLYVFLQRHYRGHVPLRARQWLDPVTGPLKNLLP